MGKHQISIFILKDSGKKRQFRFSSKFFQSMVIMTILLLILLLISTYGFFYLLWDTIEMRERNEQIARELDIVKRNLSKVQSALNDAKEKLASGITIFKVAGKKTPAAQLSKEKINKSALSSSLQMRPLEQKETPVLYPAEAKDQRVGIRDVRTFDSEDLSRLQVNLTIFNKNSQNNLVKGRVIIVAARERTEPYIYLSYPIGPLRLGEPTNPKIGRRFAIRRFVRIKGYFTKPSIYICFDKIKIFIYSPDGTLILRKEFPIEERSRKANSL